MVITVEITGYSGTAVPPTVVVPAEPVPGGTALQDRPPPPALQLVDQTD